MLKKIILVAMLLAGSFCSFAQEEEAPTPLFGDKKIRPLWMERIRYGGNVWLNFFGQFNIELSPMVGYELTNSGKTVAGVGAVYTLMGTWQNRNSAYGTRLFMRQSLFRGVFAHAEYEFLNAREDQFYGYTPPTGTTGVSRTWGGTPYVGLGLYRGARRANKGSFIAVLANPLYPNKGYRNPFSIGSNDSPLILRFGFF
jgi:hypothetical protein